LIRPARVNDGARTEPTLGHGNNGIECAAPTAANNFDIDFGIRTSADGPQHVVSVGDVDVIVDHDGVAPEICACMAIGGDHASLARMTGIALFDGDDVQQSASTRFVAPHTSDIGYASFLEFLPDQCRAHEATHVIKFARRASWRCAE